MSNSKLRKIARQLPKLPLLQNNEIAKRKLVKSVYGHQILQQNKAATDTNGKPINAKAIYSINTEEIIDINLYEKMLEEEKKGVTQLQTFFKTKN